MKAKKVLNLTVFFALWGSLRIKAAHKILVKWTPGRCSEDIYVMKPQNGGHCRQVGRYSGVVISSDLAEYFI